jgi:hypothetical protein
MKLGPPDLVRIDAVPGGPSREALEIEDLHAGWHSDACAVGQRSDPCLSVFDHSPSSICQLVT